jgi:hypothetical protein
VPIHRLENEVRFAGWIFSGFDPNRLIKEAAAARLDPLMIIK